MYSSNSSLTIEGYLLSQKFPLNRRGYYFIHNLLCSVYLNSKDENQAWGVYFIKSRSKAD